MLIYCKAVFLWILYVLKNLFTVFSSCWFLTLQKSCVFMKFIYIKEFLLYKRIDYWLYIILHIIESSLGMLIYCKAVLLWNLYVLKNTVCLLCFSVIDFCLMKELTTDFISYCTLLKVAWLCWYISRLCFYEIYIKRLRLRFSVVDSCLTKVLTTDLISNYTSLKVAWASKASCKQRAGRSGRVSEGRVYRLVPHKFFEVSLSRLLRYALAHSLTQSF